MRYAPEHSVAYDSLARLEARDPSVTRLEIVNEISDDPHAYGVATAQLEAEAARADDLALSGAERTEATRSAEKLRGALDPPLPETTRPEPTEAERRAERDAEHQFFGLWQKYAEMTTLNPEYMKSRAGGKQRAEVIEAMDNILEVYPQFSAIINRDRKKRTDAADAYHERKHRGREYDDVNADGTITEKHYSPAEIAGIKKRDARDRHDDVIIRGAHPGSDPTEDSAKIAITRDYHQALETDALARTDAKGDSLRDMLFEEAVTNLTNFDHHAGEDIREAYKTQIEGFERTLKGVSQDIEDELIRRIGMNPADNPAIHEQAAYAAYDNLLAEVERLGQEIEHSSKPDRHSETELLHYKKKLASTELRRLTFARNQVTLMASPIDGEKIRLADQEDFLNTRGRDLEYSEDESAPAMLVDEVSGDTITVFSDGAYKRGDQYYTAQGEKGTEPDQIVLEALPQITDQPDTRKRIGGMALGRKGKGVLSTEPLSVLAQDAAEKTYLSDESWFRDQNNPQKIKAARMALHVLRERIRLSDTPDVAHIRSLDYRIAVLEADTVDERGEARGSYMQHDGSVVMRNVPEMYGQKDSQWRLYPDGSAVMLRLVDTGTTNERYVESNLRYNPDGKRYRVKDAAGHLVTVA